MISSYAYEYDKTGNRTKQIEEDGAETIFEYDDMDRLTHVIYPVEKIWSLRDRYLETIERYRPVKESVAAEKEEVGNENDDIDGNQIEEKDNGKGKGNDKVAKYSFNSLLAKSRNVIYTFAGMVRRFYSTLFARNDKDNSSQDNEKVNSKDSDSTKNNNTDSNKKDIVSTDSGSNTESSSDNDESSTGGTNASGNSGNIQDKDKGNTSNDSGQNQNNTVDENNKENNSGNSGSGQQKDKEDSGNDKEKGNAEDKPNNNNDKKDNGQDKDSKDNGQDKNKNDNVQDNDNNKGNNKDRIKEKKGKPWQVEVTEEEIALGYTKYIERPDYLMEPTSEAFYTYDVAGNRTSITTDEGTVQYTYDAANRLLSDGESEYVYDANGSLTSVKTGEDAVVYSYTAANKLKEVIFPDESYVSYGYDAFGRKVMREEGYWSLTGSNNGKSHIAPGQLKESKSKGNGGKSIKNGSGEEKPLKLDAETTRYMYEGFSTKLTKEYTENGSPLGQNYYANGSIVSRKMFGLHNLNGRDAGVKTTGGMMYYQYDGLRNVSALTDRHGDLIEQYRYDAFGGLFTGITAPYNTSSFTGHSYDPKAGLVDMNARWYAPDTGRFTTADPYRGEMLTPYTQNRYAYVGNNPVNRWDPLGYWQAGDETLSTQAHAAIWDLTERWYKEEDYDERLNLNARYMEIPSKAVCTKRKC